MPGQKGKPVPSHIKKFIVDAARDDPTRSNADIKEMTKKKFRRSPDISSVRRYRDEAGIQSSRKAKVQAPTSPALTTEQKAYIQKLLDKLLLPDPDFLNASDVIRAQDVGMVGTRDVKIHVRIEDLKLTECWLSEVEFKTLNLFATGTNYASSFRQLYEDGVGIVGDILSHNWRIELGSGEPTFKDLTQLLETQVPEKLPELSNRAFELWNRYSAFGKGLDVFKQPVSDWLNPFSTSD